MNEGGTVNDYPHIYIIITLLPSNITLRAEDYQIRNMREPVLIRRNYIASPMVPTKTRSDSTKALVRDLRTIFTRHWKIYIDGFTTTFIVQGQKHRQPTMKMPPQELEKQNR
jgi:hypothetical protein